MRNRKNGEEKPYYDHIDDVYNYGNACSATECTGLIAHAPLTEEELASYMDIYDFQPPDVIYDGKEEPAYGSHKTVDESTTFKK